MDPTSYLESMYPAPCVLFNSLPTRATRPRFMLPDGKGDWYAITWQAFADEVEAITLALHALGVRSTERGAILGYNSVSWFSAALAIQAAGGVMVPIYPSSTAEQSAYVVSHSDARVLFVDSSKFLSYALAHLEEFGEQLLAIVALNDRVDLDKALNYLAESGTSLTREQIGPRIVSWSEALELGKAQKQEAPGRLTELLEAIDMEQDAVMLYTSGTTGLPKGVPLTHLNVGVNGRDWLRNNAPLVEVGDVDLLWLPLSHIFGFGELCLGNTLGFMTYWSDPSRVLDDLPKVCPQVFMSVPRLFEKMALAAMAHDEPAAQHEALMKLTGGQLRFCLSGGAGLKQEIKTFLYGHGMLIIEGYGLTETSPTLTLNRPDDFRFDSVGKPLDSVQLKLAEDGEILAKGPNVFKGYHKNPEATREAFTEDGWLKTGDIGRFTEDGFLQIIDRKKEILVTAGGKNIPPANIEICFRDEPFITHVVVYGDGKSYLTAGVWLDDQAAQRALDEAHNETPELTMEQLVQRRVEAINATLPRHETIKRFIVFEEPLSIENDLLTPTLKVKRKKVYERYRDRFESLYQ